MWPYVQFLACTTGLNITAPIYRGISNSAILDHVTKFQGCPGLRVWDNATEIPSRYQGSPKWTERLRSALVHSWRVAKNGDGSLRFHIFANHLWNLLGHVTFYHANSWCFKATSRPFQRKKWNIRCSASSIFCKETSLKEIESCSWASRDFF